MGVCMRWKSSYYHANIQQTSIYYQFSQDILKQKLGEKSLFQKPAVPQASTLHYYFGHYCVFLSFNPQESPSIILLFMI